VGNLKLEGNTISTIDLDGNLLLAPDAAGLIDVTTRRIINVEDPVDVQDAATKQYVLDETFYNSNGGFDATPRSVEGINEADLTITMNDLTNATFNERTFLTLTKNQFFLGYETGSGGIPDKTSAFFFTDTFIKIIDDLNLKGMTYAADYSSNGSLDNRWIPDKEYADYSLDSSKLKIVRLKSDLPAPVAGVITSDLNRLYWLLESVDLGTDRLVLSSGASLQGVRNSTDGNTVLSGTVNSPDSLISASGQGTYLDIQFENLGTGDVFNFDPGTTEFQNIISRRVNFVGGAFRMQNKAFACPFFNCNFTGGASIIVDANADSDFVGLFDASLLSDNADGDILIKVESGAQLGRIQIVSSAFVQQSASTAILIEDNVPMEFLDLLNAGFNQFNSDSIALQVDDPDAIELGLIPDTQFGPLGVSLRADPTSDATIPFNPVVNFGVDCMLLNGNMFISDFNPNSGYKSFNGISDSFIATVLVGNRLRGITNDGVNVIVLDDTGDTVNVMTGVGLPVDFTFATPGTNPRGAAFDGEDLWIMNEAPNMVFQMDGLTATVKNSFAVTGNTSGIDIDGTVVIVSNTTDKTLDFYTLGGTFLYSFLSPTNTNSSVGIAHQEDQYIILDSNDRDILRYDKNIPFHQGSKTWLVRESNITGSSTRIITRFQVSGGVAILATAGIFRNISDSGATIVWGATAGGFEKFFVSDPLTGKTTYSGKRAISIFISPATRFERVTGVSVTVDIGIFLNGILIDASLVSITLDSGDIFNLTYPSFVLRLNEGDEIELMFKSSLSVSIRFFGGVISMGALNG